ncbi:MAG: metallophosphoesterase [Polyangiaceae bacterium]
MPRPALIVSDLHLSPNSPVRISSALAAVLEDHADAELIVAGDSLDLSLLRDPEATADSLTDYLRPHTSLRAALQQRLGRGVPVRFVLGNHDAPLGRSDAVQALRAVLRVQDAAPLEVVPWFLRRGSVHIEHGHAYDPDNADAHPLASPDCTLDSLGIALTRRFLAPSGAMRFKHRQHTTPLAGLVDCFRHYRHRAPGIVAHYFWVAGQLCFEARDPKRGLASFARGKDKVDAFAADVGIDAERLHRLIQALPPARHLDARETFLRLYFDRTLPTAALAVSLPLALTGNGLAVGVAVASALTLAISLRGGVNRYYRHAELELERGADLVRQLTGASHVILGHTHVEADEPGYTNLGSFAFTRSDAHAYVWLDEQQRIERRVVA